MKKKIVVFIIFCSNFILFAQDPKEINYIVKYAKLAVNEMQLYKIPASITLSQGILETGGGQSRLAEEANNHFGIKCKEEWKGEKIYHNDDALGECFRKYLAVEESYRDHSKFLAERPYYKNLFLLPLTDYKAWSHGLKKSGYATNPNYGTILINKIEKYNLSQLDNIKPDEVEQKLAEIFPNQATNYSVISEITPSIKPIIPEVTVPQKEQIILLKEETNPLVRIKNHPNGLDYIVVEKGESIASISKIYQISQSKLLIYNDLINPILIEEGQFIFFTKKKPKGLTPKYTVKKNETMYQISQKEGIKLHKLYEKNKIKYSQELEENQILILQ